MLVPPEVEANTIQEDLDHATARKEGCFIRLLAEFILL